MPCIAAPTIGAPSISASVSIPGLSAGIGGGSLSASALCCTFKLPIPSITIILPPLNASATVVLEAGSIIVAEVLALLRSIEPVCPVQ